MSRTPPPRRFTRAMNQASEAVLDRYLEQLRREYVWTIREAARLTSVAFREQATALPDEVTAAGDLPENPEIPPRFLAPDPDVVINNPKITEAMVKRTQQTRKAAAQQQLDDIGTRLGVSFDIGSEIFAPELLKSAGQRANDLGRSIRDRVVKVIQYGLVNGLSVDETATIMKAEVSTLTTTLAVMLARTDLISVTNGSSMAAAREVYGTGPETTVMKTWLATDDEKTRETHADADGQSVPLDQPFDVGGDLLDYPGDPNGSDEEVINCRCTFLVEEVATVAQTPDQTPEGVEAGPTDAPEAVAAP